MTHIMNMGHRSVRDSKKRPVYLRRALKYVAAPVPLPLVNIVLKRLVRSIAKNRPELFRRLEGHHDKKFIINPINLPFSMCLRPDPRHPELVAYRRWSAPQYSAKISGSLLTLLGMIDGRYDGDALFFTRDLRVEGDTEAVVCLRNAIDDVEGSVADDVAAFFGPTGVKILNFARKINIHE